MHELGQRIELVAFQAVLDFCCGDETIGRLVLDIDVHLRTDFVHDIMFIECSDSCNDICSQHDIKCDDDGFLPIDVHVVCCCACGP